MKAAVNTEYGPPEVIRIADIPVPAPKQNEILVKVRAATVNRTDCGILWGKPAVIKLFTGLRRPSTPVRGTDFAGVVEAVGPSVTKFAVGDRVWGFDDAGVQSHAEYLTIAEKKPIEKIPENISFVQAAAAPEGAHYAYNFVTKVSLKPGDRVLVNGASGAIGSAGLQILKYLGATVTAVVGTKNVALAASLGADRVINFETEDFTSIGEQFRFVFDAVGKSTFEACSPLLLPGGIYISSELGPGGENLYLPFLTKLRGGKRTIFPIPVNIPRSLTFIGTLLRNGAFVPVIDRTYRLEQIAEAYRYVVSGQKTGNVVITFD